MTQRAEKGPKLVDKLNSNMYTFVPFMSVVGSDTHLLHSQSTTSVAHCYCRVVGVLRRRHFTRVEEKQFVSLSWRSPTQHLDMSKIFFFLVKRMSSPQRNLEVNRLIHL